MIWNNHYRQEGQHAFLSASKSTWLRYSPEKLKEAFLKANASELGTRMHAWAAEAIKLKIKQARSSRTICAYINDAIGFGMDPEVILFYSDNCFGTADTISFRNNFLRIHDLKTGEHEAKFEQLYVYTALFCLEYHQDPFKIQMELRIYQNDEVRVDVPDPSIIKDIMDKIVDYDALLNTYKSEMY